MPQKKIDNGGYELRGLKTAASNAAWYVNHKIRYSVFYSIFTHIVHIVGEGVDPDPDWLECETLTPYAMSQQAIADCIVSKLNNLKTSGAVQEALRKVFDEPTGK